MLQIQENANTTHNYKIKTVQTANMFSKQKIHSCCKSYEWSIRSATGHRVKNYKSAKDARYKQVLNGSFKS